MKTTSHLMLIFALCVAPCTGLTTTQGNSVVEMEQRTYDYDILREGSPVGSHQVHVEYDDERIKVVSRSLIEIGLLGLTFYRFQYESEEEWDEQGLRRLLVWVDDDGERVEIDGHRSGDQFIWTKNDADPNSHEMPVFPTNHWNSAVVSQTRVLNTLTGSMNRVSIQPHENKTPNFDQNSGELKNYRYDGELRLDSWYDISGRWVGMRFEGKDGSTIEYRCSNCWAWRSL